MIEWTCALTGPSSKSDAPSREDWEAIKAKLGLKSREYKPGEKLRHANSR